MVHFSELTFDLLPSAYRLSTQAGWNQTEEDWARLLRINPHGVRVWADQGEVRAAFSVIGHGGRVAWIGMILVDGAHRGRGLGKIAFEHALRLAREQEFPVVGLDATHLGEPIYSKFGFEIIAPVVRWAGVLRAGEAMPTGLEFRQGFPEEVLEFDRSYAGEDRSALLRDLAKSALVFCLKRESGFLAYAAVRPGRTALQIGPVVACSYEAFSQLFTHLSQEFSGQNVLCDLLNPEGEAALSALKLQPSRHLKRMTLPRQKDCLCGAAIWCGAGFEWG